MDGNKLSDLAWDDLRFLLALAQEGTLVGAARLMGVEHATVSRRIVSLEAALNQKLIDRRGRNITLTPEGERVVELASPIVTHINAIRQISRIKGDTLTGDIRISAPPALSTALLVKPLSSFQQRHAGISLTLVGEKRFTSLNKREADIAIRLDRPEEGDYIISKLMEIEYHLYATPDYLAKVPESEWTFIAYDDASHALIQQQLLLAISADRAIRLKSSILEFQADSARAGSGVAILPDFLADSGIGLKRITTKPVHTGEAWLVIHADINELPIIRLLAEALKSFFSARQLSFTAPSETSHHP